MPLISFTGSREVGARVVSERGAASEERPSRARRQERDHRHGRRRPRARGRRDPLVGVRDVRAALHGGEPCDRDRPGLRAAAVGARRAGRRPPPRQRPRAETDVGPVDQRRGAREGALLHAGRPRRGSEAPDRRRDRDRGRARPGLLLPADGVRRRRPGDADRAGGDLRARRRRSSRRRTSTRRSGSRTASSSASPPRSSPAT